MNTDQRIGTPVLLENPASFGTGMFSFPAFPEYPLRPDIDAIDDGLDGERGSDYRLFRGEFGVAGSRADFLGDTGGFHGPDAFLTPFGDGHGFDQFELRVGLREVFRDEAGQQRFETLFVFSFEND
jgi:hypothetical protein